MMSRGVINYCCSFSPKITIIWFISAFTFYFFFRMALRNSSSHDDVNPNRPAISAQSSISYAEHRSILYAKMAKDLDENGAVFLRQGETSQSLSLSDIFTLKDGTVTPVLKAANPPVRANVLHLNPEYSIPISGYAIKTVLGQWTWSLSYGKHVIRYLNMGRPISKSREAVKNILLPYFGKAIWFQNSSMYHFSMFHASHHISPVPATETEIEVEASAIKTVTETICPLNIFLDRVVLTSTGVLLGCWQVISGTDPVTIRTKLKNALPRAPEKQLYNEVMLHTSFARLLGHPDNLPEEGQKVSGIQIFHELVNRVNNKIRGMKATVSDLWYVEEYDMLALALNGKMKVREFHFGCSNA